MSSPEKHKINPLMEWLDEEAPTLTAMRRGGAANKSPKPLSRRYRAPVAIGAGEKIEPAMMREAAQSIRIDERASQANSREHLLKQQRLPMLRAPHSTKPARAAGAGR